MSSQSQHAIHYGRGSHANAIHFYQQIQPHQLQDEELKIRRSFVERYWKGVSNPILLTLPNGSEWKMHWIKGGEDIWLQKNWKKFAWSLRSGDQLVFKYKGESNFEVIIFDDSALEIDYSSIRCNRNSNGEEEEDAESDDDCVEVKNDSEKLTQSIIKEEKINSNEELRSFCNPHLETNNIGKKRKINTDSAHQNVSGVTSDRGGTDKKINKGSRTEDVKERDKNSDRHKNPSFVLILTQSYIQEYKMRIPSRFSKEYLNELEGTATIKRVGEEKRSWDVKLKFDAGHGHSVFSTGWKSFSHDNSLKAGDLFKFEITQSKPFSFRITITRVTDQQPSPEQLQERFPVEIMEYLGSFRSGKFEESSTEGISRSCQNTHDSESVDMKLNTFKVSVESLDMVSVPTEFLKRHKIRNGNSVELKVGEKSWHVEVSYYPQLSSWRFFKGWKEFARGCNVMIGDTCLFEMIDEENLVFKVAILLDV